MSDKEFPSGLFAKAPHERAPDFVKCSLSIKRADLGNWLRGKSDEWINLQVKESRGGKWYVEVDNWKPDSSKEKHEQQKADGYQPSPDDFSDDVPFLQFHRWTIA